MTDFGKSIALDEIEPKRKVNQDTLMFYKRVVIKVNQMLCVPESNRLYYEYLGKPEVRDKIMQEIPNLFKISTPTAFTSKMAAVKSFMLSVPDLPSEISLLWNKKYVVPEFIVKVGDPPSLNHTWNELKQKMQALSEDKSKDTRLRIICYIYSAELVVRTSVLTTTRINEDNGVDNFYNKDTGEWIIRKTKTGLKQTLQLPDNVVKGIKEIIERLPFIYNEWLVPRLNGQRYVSLALANFTPWRNENLPGCNECRHTFETYNWNSGLTHDEAAAKSKLLDHNPSTVSNFYVKSKPKPVIKLRKPIIKIRKRYHYGQKDEN